MKRAIALALLLALCAIGCAHGDAAGFSFRNGLTWGMKPQAVLAAEGGPEYDSGTENGMEVLTIRGAKHRELACEIDYLFFDGGLVMARIQYDTGAVSVSPEELMARLSQSYGEATRLDPAQVAELSLDGVEAPDSFYGWVLNDETLIFLTERRDEHRLRITLADIRERPET